MSVSRVRDFLLIGLLVLAGTAALAGDHPTLSVESSVEELLDGSREGEKPAIATDGLGQPHVAVRMSAGAFALYDKLGTSPSGWQAPIDISTAQYWPSAQSLDLPKIAIDDRIDAAYTIGFMVTAGNYNSVGVLTIVRPAISTAPRQVYVSRNVIVPNSPPAWDSGTSVNVDPFTAGEFIISSNEGWWRRYRFDAAAPFRLVYTGENGQMYAGTGGEKSVFTIAPGGVWHGAVNGWVRWSSSYQNSTRTVGPTTWAVYQNYPQQMEEGAYPNVAGDAVEPETAYIVSFFDEIHGRGDVLSGPKLGIVLNVWTGNGPYGGFVFDPAGGLKILDPEGETGSYRAPPSIATAKDGGAWVCWTGAGGQVRVCHVSSDGDVGEIYNVANGYRAAVGVDADGDVHVVYMNNGVRYRKISASGGGSSYRVGTAQDFDGDGADDMAMFDNGIWRIRYSMDPPSKAGAVPELGTWGDIAAPGDFDGDGTADKAIFRPSLGTWYLWRSSNGYQTVSFGLQDDVPVVRDYDGNGSDDIAVCRRTAESNLVWYIDGIAPQGIPFGKAEDIPVPGNYDADPAYEVAVCRRTSPTYPQNLVWHIHGVTPTEGAPYGLADDTPVPADYDGDGITDIAIFRPANGLWAFFGSDVGNTVVQWGTSGDVPVPGDYDGDDETDIAVYRPENMSWYVSSSEQGGALIEQWPVYLGAAGDQPISGDFDGDNRADILAYRRTEGVWRAWLSGAEGAARNDPIAFPYGLPGDMAIPADYDGDGIQDVAVFRPSTAEWHINGSSWGPMYFVWGSAGDTPRPADIDGDLRADFIVTRPNPPNMDWHIWGTTVGYIPSFAWGASTDIPVPDDYNGGGLADIAVYRPVDATWHVWLTGGGPGVLTFGLGSDTPLHGDFDNDGTADIGIFNQGVWAWYGSTAGQFGPVTWGAPTDLPVPGDYDGDGLNDLSIFRPAAEAEWWILRSDGGGHLARGPVRWGWLPSDEPIGARN